MLKPWPSPPSRFSAGTTRLSILISAWPPPSISPRRALDGHRLDVADDVVAGVRELDEERAELLVTRRVGVRLRHDQRDIGDAGGAAEPLLAVENPVVAIADGAGLHAGCVSAGGLLGHRVADALFAVEQRLEELLLLEGRAVREEREHRGVVGALRVQGERAEIALAQFHLDERVGQRSEAHAAELGWDERAPKPLRACLLAQLGEHLLVGPILELLLRRNALVLDELADAFSNFLRLGRNLEVDCHAV